ncbi:MAG: hypothetical protein OSB14_07160, partial [Planctomycetota bacterium]|nr:hypothetical protein [Planctomycetota bacterium]
MIQSVIALLVPLLLFTSQGPLQLDLETPDGRLSSHDLVAPLAAPLPEGVAFIRYVGGSSA